MAQTSSTVPGCAVRGVASEGVLIAVKNARLVLQLPLPLLDASGS